MDIAGVVVGFETELSFVDLLVAEISPKPIATAASPAVTHTFIWKIGRALLYLLLKKKMSGQD
jgi:hypothetical protein